jgi:hypothetical protein
LNYSSSSLRPDHAGRATGLASLVRRICLLREQGDVAEARRVQETELADRIREMRESADPAALTDAALADLFATETRRVADALATAEVLIPQLVAIWPAGPAARPARLTLSVPTEAPARPAAADGPPRISDLLDAMLAAERSSTRSTPAQKR